MASRGRDVSDGQTPAQRRAQFAEQVHEALTHLYDLSYLQTHPLARIAAQEMGSSQTNRGRTLRQGIHEAIDAIRPDSRLGEVRVTRAHRLLTLRYVEGREIEAIVATLGTSRSEYFRDHRLGVEAVTSLLWERWGIDSIEAERHLLEDRGQGVRSDPTPRSGSGIRGATPLPAPVTSFVGREREQSEVTRLLNPRTGTTRLLTLLGTGGCGKSRLALEVARLMVDAFPDGIWLVELAPLVDSAQVEPSMAAAIGVRETPGKSIRQTLIDVLQARRALLLLDNCEHLVDACAEIAEDLLTRCPQMRVLATSRESLRVAGEVRWRVPPLEVPPSDEGPVPLSDQASLATRYGAIQLFVDRAQSAQPSFALTDRNVDAVVEVCRRLDGIPLAIELAAARLTTLSIQQISERLTDRFRLLSEGSRTAAPRHQTLRNAIDWSYSLLGESEQALFRRLAIFVGGFGLDAAQAIGRPIGIAERAEVGLLDRLDLLIEKSLVRVIDGGDERSFEMFDSIREYGWEKLRERGEVEEIRRRHAEHCLTIVEAVARSIWRPGPDYSTRLRQLDREQENVVLALGWVARNRDPACTLRWGAALGWFWRQSASAPTDPAVVITDRLAEPDHSGSSQVARAQALFGAAYVAWRRRDYAAAETLFEDSRNAWPDEGTGEETALLRPSRGLDLLTRWERYDLAAQSAYADVRTQQTADDPIGTAWSSLRLGWLAFFRDECESAEKLFAEAELQLSQADALEASAAARFGRGWIAHESGNVASASAHYAACLDLLRSLGHSSIVPYVLDNQMILEATAGDLERAARLAGAAAAVRAANGDDGSPLLLARLDRWHAQIRRALGEAKFAAAWSRGMAGS